jgi:hypothetical protein
MKVLQSAFLRENTQFFGEKRAKPTAAGRKATVTFSKVTAAGRKVTVTFRPWTVTFPKGAAAFGK